MGNRKAQKAASVAFAEENAHKAFDVWFEKEQAFKKGQVSACVEKRAWKRYQKAMAAVFDARYA